MNDHWVEKSKTKIALIGVKNLTFSKDQSNEIFACCQVLLFYIRQPIRQRLNAPLNKFLLRNFLKQNAHLLNEDGNENVIAV